MSPDEAEFVDRLGLFFELLGATRRWAGSTAGC